MKPIIRAFALGLLTAALIIGISFKTNGTSEQKAESSTPTTTELISQLEEQGYEVTSPDEKVESTKSNEKEKSSKEEQKEDETATEEESTSPKTYILSIESGMSLRDISEDLSEAGILEDVEAFDEYMKAKDYSRFIQIGKFELNSDMSYKQIAKTITSK
jgi:hypothetical protein